MTLLGLTAITIRGTLGVARGRSSGGFNQSASRASVQPSQSFSPSAVQTGRAQAVNIAGQRDSADTEEAGGFPATDATLTQWKVVEMFKVWRSACSFVKGQSLAQMTLNHIQMTVLIATLDVGWVVPFLVMAEIAGPHPSRSSARLTRSRMLPCSEFLGSLAIESIRRSVVCLSGESQSLHATAWASIVSVCIVPASVFLLLALLWTTNVVCRFIERPVHYLAKRALLSIMVLWYITSVAVIKTTLGTVLCVSAHNVLDATDGEKEMSYWAVDTSLKCFEGDHQTLAVLILSFVGIVYGGLLIAFVAILGSAEERLNDADHWIYQTMGFLYRSYRHGWRRYWEVAIVARKAGVAFLVFCAHRFDSVLPIIGSAVFLTLALGVQMVAMPYRQRSDVLNKIELSSLFASLLTLLLATMLKSGDSAEGRSGWTLSALCGLLNIGTLIVFLSFLMHYFVDHLRVVMRERGTRVNVEGVGDLRVLKIWAWHEAQRLACLSGLFGPESTTPSLS